MNVDYLCFTLTQIDFLVQTLNKKNYKQNVDEILKLVSTTGFEADRHLFSAIFKQIYLQFTTPTGNLNQNHPSSVSVWQLFFSELFACLVNKPSFISIVCFSFEQAIKEKQVKLTAQNFPVFLHNLRLSAPFETLFCFALLHCSCSETIRIARAHLRAALPTLVENYVETETSSFNDINPEQLHFLLNQSEFKSLSKEIRELFLIAVQRDFVRDFCIPTVLAPLLFPDKYSLPMASQDVIKQPPVAVTHDLGRLVSELGAAFTNNVDECRTAILNFVASNNGVPTGPSTGINDGNSLIQPPAIAKCLCLMLRHYHHVHQQSDELLNIQGPNGFWTGNVNASSQSSNKTQTVDISQKQINFEIFVQVLNELNPNLQWTSVIIELDCNEFIVKDRNSLINLMQALKFGLQLNGYNSFPIDHLYKRWKNTENQFNLISTILKNQDVFSFADYPYHSVNVEILKTQPEVENKEIQTWRSLNLIELLLQIAECGFYVQVQEIFKFPVQNCPDVLILGLLQISGPLTMLRQELFTSLMPIFLGNHPNSGLILHHCWHSQNLNIKPIIMHTMAEFYLRDNDQTRLSRILDVAQDLKALSLLLNSQSFPFVIDLACLAARREYLKLEKWLSDKIRDHGESFIQACIKFLQKRCCHNSKTEDLILGKVMPSLPQETMSTMLVCLQTAATPMSKETQDAILSLSNLLYQKRTLQQQQQQSQRSQQTGSVAPQPPPPNTAAAAAAAAFHLVDLAPPPPQQSAQQPPQTAPTAAFNLNLTGLAAAAAAASVAPPPNQSPFSMVANLQQNQQQQIAGSAASLMNLTRMGTEKPRAPESALFLDMTHNVSKEVEDEANSYFQRIYNHPPHPTLSIDEVLDMLKKFQDSPIKREQDVFHCMLRNLFEEYRFFPQYPEKELHTTALLFGGIIERGLVSSYMALGLALRFVLDALRKPEGTKMYYFGIAALDRFKTRLKEYHKYCEHVRAISHFHEFPPHLIDYVEYGLQSLEPPVKPQASTSTNPTLTSGTSGGTAVATTSGFKVKNPTSTNAPGTSALGSRPSIATATNIDTLLTAPCAPILTPPDSLQDKTAFIFNNLSQLNLQTKCEEFRELIGEEYFPWLSQYLVMKRASIELNFHALYSNFLDVLKQPTVIQMVIKETFRNIKVLLRSDKGIANFSDRSLLKNLGHWLGILTLARNKPILLVDLNLKNLLIEAYHKGQQELLYVVPFVAKVLESCAKSRVFKPPNPWTMSIMNVLAELHQEPDLKLNLKFEIEVLCKNLEIDVAQLKPGSVLKNSVKVEMQLSGGLGGTTPAKDEQLIQQSGSSSSSETSSSQQGLSAPEPKYSYLDIPLHGSTAFQTLLTINPNLPMFQTQPHLKSLIRPAIERAVHEWLIPVVDRSIKIALTTCEQIIRKDFALDCDENRLRTAAHFMTRNLTAGMAMITCREQLVSTICQNIKAALATSISNKETIEFAANCIAQENMELACAYIQKTAIEKAIPEIDKRLMNDIELRKMARNEGRRYCDTMALTYQAERMPEQIRLKVGGVTAQQMAVYEEFARNIPGFLPLSERDAALIFLAKPQPLPQEITSTSTVAPPTPTVYPHATPPCSEDQLSIPSSVPALGSMITLYDKIMIEVEQLLSGNSTGGVPANSNVNNINNGNNVNNMNNINNVNNMSNLNNMANMNNGGQPALASGALSSIHECLLHARRNCRDFVNALTLLQKTLEGLSNAMLSPRVKDVFVHVLKTLQDPRCFGPHWSSKHILRFLSEAPMEIRFSLDFNELLLRNQLITIPQYDIYLAHQLESSSQQQNLHLPVNYVIQLFQTGVDKSEFQNTIEMLLRLANHTRSIPESLVNLVESLKNTEFSVDRNGSVVQIHNGILHTRSRAVDDDPPGLLEKTDFLLREWVTLFHTAGRDTTKAFGVFVHQMNLHGILKTDDLITRFFRLSTQICVETVYRNLQDSSMSPQSVVKTKCYHTLDAFVRLISLLVKHSGDSQNSSTKIHLLNKVLGIVTGCLLQDHENRAANEFNQLPYHRIFIMLFLELNNPDAVLETINFQILTAFCHTYHILRPAKASGFCYAWLELISHRVFLGRILALTPQQKGWGIFAQLLIDLFKFLSPFLRNAELAKPVTLLYKGTLRVLLVLLHDFPEFLCDYHYGFCDVIPPNCIQMRNLILSAFPRNMRLPDPFTPNLKVDLLQEISIAPRILSNFSSMIQPAHFKKDLDSYLKIRAPVTFLSDLRSNLQVTNGSTGTSNLNEPSPTSVSAGTRYNIQLMNALVLYVGTQAIAYIRSKNLAPNMSTIAHSAHMDIFQNLAVDLDTEGRYLFLNAIANQLRYPNSHTHYFSCTILYLFAEANTEAIQEQITRVLLERLIVNRPHPWGLLITFIELIKNPTYKFWNHEFVHCAPEIEKLFESVARSCMVQKTTLHPDADATE